jgi:hypothetical protein
VKDLLHVIKDWELEFCLKIADKCPQFKLRVKVYSPSDMNYGACRTLAPNRYRRNLLRLLDTEDIPDVRLVKSFGSFGQERRRQIEPSCLANLANKFQCLASLKWLVKDDEKRFGGTLRKRRTGKSKRHRTSWPLGFNPYRFRKHEFVFSVIIPKACD